MTTLTPKPSFALVTLLLPGPDRKRRPSPYHFRVTYRNPEPEEPGCLMTWDVYGGREPYQVALEHTPDGRAEWHCTCPDAVYHGADRAAHRCKHVQGLREMFPAPRPAAA
jgi:hypothetical protein